MPVAEMLAKNPAAIILSGGPSSVYAEGAPRLDRALFEAGVPVFGMCYGFQLMATTLGGTVDNTGAREYGRTAAARLQARLHALRGHPGRAVGVDVARRRLLRRPRGLHRHRVHGRRPGRRLRERREEALRRPVPPRGACTPRTASRSWSTSSTAARASTPTWTTGNVVEEQVAAIREQVGNKRAICGLSGGVDSAVAAALVQKAIGAQLTCVYVDHGLMRKGETEQVEKDFVAATGVQLKVVDARGALPDRAGRGLRPRGEAEDHRPRVHPGLRAGPGRDRRRGRRPARTSSSWSRAPSTRTSSSPAAAPAPPTSSPTTTWAASPRTWSSSSSSRCASCSRTRSGWSARSSACPRRSSSASRSPAPASASASSARSPRSASTCCARPTPSPARS